MARQIQSYYQKYVAKPKQQAPAQTWIHLLNNRAGLFGLAIFIALLVHLYDGSGLWGRVSALLAPAEPNMAMVPAPQSRASETSRGGR